MTDLIAREATSPLALALRVLPAVALGCALAAATGVFAAEPAKADAAKGKPMNMDAPMAGGMKKEGMTLGDVKKAEKKWDRKMREMMEKEQQSRAAEKK